MIAVGADGCKGGWLALRVRDGRLANARLFVDADALWSAWGDAELLLLDVPIGLPDEGPERRCDLEARRVLGRPRAASVFPAPSRPALLAADYEAACRINELRSGRRLSRQTWAIMPKIREVDALLAAEPRARGRCRESHPEVCFWALAGRPMRGAKRTPQGQWERIKVLGRVMPAAPLVVRRVMNAFPRRFLACDDVLDALALAVTAALASGGSRTVPDEPERDARGLPMEMVHVVRRP